MYIHDLEYFYSVYFTNTKGAYLENVNINIRPEDCEYAQHDLILKFDEGIFVTILLPCRDIRLKSNLFW